MHWIFVCLLQWIFVFCLNRGLACGASYMAPDSVRVGGMFSPLSHTASVYVDQAEHLAAFVMAANDINDKTDGILDDLLPNTTFAIAIGIEHSLATAATTAVQLTTAFDGQGINGVVSALHNRDALVVTQLLNSMNIMIMLSMADTGAFNNIGAYPYVANIRALVSRQGMVMQNMLCLSTTRKIVVFASTEEDYIQMLAQFQDESICQLDILAVISVRADLTDLTYEIAQAVPIGSRYYVNMLPASQNAGLLEQGYAAGLFHDNTVIYTSSHSIKNITQYFAPDTDVARVMTGVFYVKFNPTHYLGQIPESTSFTRRWSEQPSRAGTVVNGKHVCDTTKDDTGKYLYQVTTSNNETVCTGLDFSTYKASGSNMKSYTALTYDSTIFLAMAIDFAIRNNLDYEDPVALLNIMIANLTYTGATGPLGLFKGYPEYGYEARGTRSAGTQYKVYNFNPYLYNNGSSAFFVKVGTFDGDARTYTACSPIDRVSCFPPIYSAATDGSYHIAPSDTPSVIIFAIPTAFSTLCYLLSGMVAVLVLVFGLFTFIHRRSKVIKASQPLLLWCILVGGLISALRILFGGLPNSSAVCSGEVWFGHLGFIVMIGSLFVKSYRVHCIVNTRKLVRVTFSAMHAFRILLCIVSAAVAFLIATQLVGKPVMREQSTIVANQQTDVQYCALEYSQFQTTLFVLEGFLLAISFRVCWEIRKVPDVVNESKQISTAMSAIVMVSVLILPIVYFLGLNHYTQDFVASFGFACGAVVTLTLLFVPKIMVQFQWNSVRLSAKVAAESMLSSNNKKHTTGSGATETEESQANHDAELKLKGKSKEEKLFICQEQLRRWQALLLTQQRAALNSNSTSSNHHSSSGGVGSSSPVRMNGSILASVVEADTDLNGGCELFAMDPNAGMNFTGCTVPGLGVGSIASTEDLVVQEMV
jgi:hypothetical protein